MNFHSVTLFVAIFTLGDMFYILHISTISIIMSVVH